MEIADILSTSTLLLIFTVIAYFTWFRGRKVLSGNNKLPPGPWGIPVFGYYLCLGDKAHMTLAKLTQKYGDIFSLRIGSRLVVVLNSYELIKAALKNEAFSGRPGVMFIPKGEIPGIFQAEGDLCRDYRKFSLAILKDFGFGKLSMEPRIKEEIRHLLSTIENLHENPTDVSDLFHMSISDVICSVMFGKRFDYSDPKFQSLVKLLHEFVERTGVIKIITFFPYLIKVPRLLALVRYRQSKEKKNPLLNYMRKRVDESSLTHSFGNEDDFVSAWLTEAARRDPVDRKHLTKEHLTHMVLSLFIAGSDAAANTLLWGLLYFMKHPEVQWRVQKEIDEVVGHERTPSVTDQELMPYTQATITEIHRMCSMVPIANHRTVQDTQFMGYFIPENTLIFPNLWAVHYDPQIFKNPEEFRPERFLDSKGKYVKNDNVIPFSSGKRSCLGESLARMEVFLYFTSLLQRFSFKKPEGDTLNFDYDVATVSMPRPFKTIAVVRKEAKV